MKLLTLYHIMFQRTFLQRSIRRFTSKNVFSMGQAASPPTLLGVRAMRLHGPRSYSSGASQGSSRVVEGKASSDQSHAPPSSQVKWPRVNHSGHTSFDPVFLRDCCSCERCVDPSTTQKTFETAEIPTTIRATSVDLQNDGSVHIKWEPDLPGFQDHVSIYDGSFVDGNENLKSRLRATYNLDGKRIPWNRKLIAENEMSVQYTDYMNSSSTLLSSLRHLYHYGLLLIHSVPSNLESVASIARRIGPLKSTLYGPTWDVKSVPSAKNVAYTSSHLGFHMVSLCYGPPCSRALKESNRICCTSTTRQACRSCIVWKPALEEVRACSATLCGRSRRSSRPGQISMRS